MLIYSFRSNSDLPILLKLFPDLFIFGELNKDMERFSAFQNKRGTTKVFGLAKIASGYSRFETKAVNRFQKSYKVNRYNDCDEYSLQIPEGVSVLKNRFKMSKSCTSSFCNWTMYKIAEMKEKNQEKFEFHFCHYKIDDLDALVGLLQVMKNT